jgi:hypothetical protein
MIRHQYSPHGLQPSTEWPSSFRTGMTRAKRQASVLDNGMTRRAS